MKYHRQVREGKPKVLITKRNQCTNFTKTKEKEKELNPMAINTEKIQRKLRGKLLKRTKDSLNKMSFKQLIREYYTVVKNSSAIQKEKKRLRTLIKKPLSEAQWDTLFAQKVRKAVLEMIKKMGTVKKLVREMGDIDDIDIEEDDIVEPTSQEAPVSDEFEDGDEELDIEDEESIDMEDEIGEPEGDIDDEDIEFDLSKDIDLGFEDEMNGTEGEIEGLIGSDISDDEDEELDIEDEESIDDLDIDLEDEGGEEDLDSEIEEPEPELSEAQKKQIRMERMKNKALKLAQKRVSEEEIGDTIEGTDPSEGVDATLAGNEELFSEIPDIDANGLNMDDELPPDSDLGTNDKSDSPNIPAEKTDADDWITADGSEAGKGMKDGGTTNVKGTTENLSKWNVTTIKEEKLDYKKLMNGDYFKRVQG